MTPPILDYFWKKSTPCQLLPFSSVYLQKLYISERKIIKTKLLTKLHVQS